MRGTCAARTTARRSKRTGRQAGGQAACIGGCGCGWRAPWATTDLTWWWRGRHGGLVGYGMPVRHAGAVVRSGKLGSRPTGAHTVRPPPELLLGCEPPAPFPVTFGRSGHHWDGQLLLQTPTSPPASQRLHSTLCMPPNVEPGGAMARRPLAWRCSAKPRQAAPSPLACRWWQTHCQRCGVHHHTTCHPVAPAVVDWMLGADHAGRAAMPRCGN